MNKEQPTVTEKTQNGMEKKNMCLRRLCRRRHRRCIRVNVLRLEHGIGNGNDGDGNNICIYRLLHLLVLSTLLSS